MAQCFTEAKPFNPSPMHMYGSTCSKSLYSDGNVDPLKGYDAQREGASKEGGLLIKGYGSFGMPGGLRSNQGSCEKSSMKEAQPSIVNHTAPCLSDCNSGLNLLNSAASATFMCSPLSNSSHQGRATSHTNGAGAEKRSVGCNEAVGGSGNASADRTSLGKMVIGSSSKAGDIPKPNQSSRGALVCSAPVAEGTVGRPSSSSDGNIGLAASTDNCKAGEELVRAHGGGFPILTSTGETTPPTASKHELSSQRTPPQSWPNSPANLRAVSRTRNLSEGSFNFIFPGGDFEKTSSGTRSTLGSPCRGWSTGAESSSVSRSSSDGCVLGTINSPLNPAGVESRMNSYPESSNQLGPRDSDSPTKDLRSGLTGKNAFSGGHQSPCNSRANTKLKGPNSTCSQAANQNSKTVACATLKPTISEGQSTSSSYVSSIANSSSSRGTSFSNHSNDKSFHHGVITGGSFGRIASTHPIGKNPNGSKAMQESPSLGNITKGLQNGSMMAKAPSSFGNIIKENSSMDVKKTNPEKNAHPIDANLLLREALSSMDPEEVKNIGNDRYKKGRFADALLLYERAVFLLPGQALYHSNLAAALAALGRLGDAIQECQEAIKLYPTCGRARQRLASLLLRLGRAEDAKEHFRAAGNLSDPRDMQRADIILKHVTKCLEARTSRDWVIVIRESDAAVVAGADSASKLFALKAEALLHLGKLDEAASVMIAAQKVESSLEKNRSLAESSVQIVQAEINLAHGKFQEAIGAAELAVKIDPKKLEASSILQKARIVCQSRTRGNELYKAGKYFEASAAYGEGLERDPANAVLLCNRAACRFNLGRYESAIEDCTAALTAQPKYVKARLRRAHCYTKLEHWEEALRDYEILRGELPGDIEVAKAQFDVQVAVKKSQGEDLFRKCFGDGIHQVSSTNQFREAVTCSGLVVVYFDSKDKGGCGQLSAHVIQLCKKYPAVNFVKVNVEENWQLVKLEKVAVTPSFQLYKNGLKVKEIEAPPSHRILEQAIQLLVY